MKFSHYWISPSLSSLEPDISQTISALNKDSTKSLDEGTPYTIHIAPIDTVISKYGSNNIYISDNCLKEIESKGLTYENIQMLNSNQLISLCLLGVCISSTGFSSEDINQIAQKVHLLGGTYEHTFSDRVQVLIASKSVSQKVYTAASENIPIVQIDWIDSCFQSLFRISYDQFILPPFYHIQFTSTDLLPKEARALSEIITKLGGEFSEKFDKTTTFLLANTISTTKKFEMALKFNIPIVTTEWIRLCSHKNKIIDPTPFIINAWCVNDKFSQIFNDTTFGISKDVQNKDLLVDIILANNGSYSENPNYYITNTKTSMKNAIQVTPLWLLMCCKEKKILNSSISFTYSPLSFPPKIQGVSGHAFQLANIKEDHRIEYAEILRSFGASVFYNFSKTASMIIAENTSSRLLSTAKNYSIPVVKVSWLIELCRTGVFPNVKEHLHASTNSVDLHSICQQISESVRANQIKQSMSTLQNIEIDYSQLDRCTQRNYNEKSSLNEIGYGSSQENYEINLNTGDDPLLAALADL